MGRASELQKDTCLGFIIYSKSLGCEITAICGEPRNMGVLTTSIVCQGIWMATVETERNLKQTNGSKQGQEGTETASITLFFLSNMQNKA